MNPRKRRHVFACAAVCGERPATFVRPDSTTPGAARNAGVRRSSGRFFLISDGSESLPVDHASNGSDALNAATDADFAAAAGGSLFGAVRAGSPIERRIDAAALVGGPWCVGPAIVRRRAFDDCGGFDEGLPALVDWDFLLTLCQGGRCGVLLADSGSRYVDDDIRLRESTRPECHLPAQRRIFTKHLNTFHRFWRNAILERERTAQALFEYEQTLLIRRRERLAEVDATKREIAALAPVLRRNGLRSIDFADLRRTSPVSRNWGSERGLPIDRHYILRFLTQHAADIHGRVLEMLDSSLTAAFGGERVDHADVLDIDPGNTRATLIGDLRVAQQLPLEAYDCFILTQTLHLIDDMAAALEGAYRVLKPGGVLLATLPSASMVATEYGARGDHWRVTEAGARALFERVFSPADLEIRAHGNVLTIAAFLYGLCCDDLDPEEFAHDDPAYPLLITVRARKPARTSELSVVPARGQVAAVLCYHRVARTSRDTHAITVSPEAFRSQLAQLRERWRVVPLQTLTAASAAGEPLERGIALTFDDGYVDNLQVAAPILAEFGMPATFFVTSESHVLRRRFWWDVLEEALLWADTCPQVVELRFDRERRRYEASDLDARRAAHDALYFIFKTSAPVVRDDLLAQLAQQIPVSLESDVHRPMVPDEVRRLREFPLIEIGAHGLHHRSLPHLSPESRHRDVFESRSALERLTAGPVTSFAYPFGDVTPDAVETVMSAGFQVAVSCETRGLRAREHPLRIPRLMAREESGGELTERLRQTPID